jgi:hypothetical protein
MEGGKEMNDILLGTIIGGAVGVTGSAIVAWIQARNSQQQHARQIQHEKDSQLLSRRIAVRLRYLEPLTSHLCSLYISVNNCWHKLIEMTVPYGAREERQEVRVPKVDKREFIGKMETIEGIYREICGVHSKVYDAAGQVGDTILINKLADITNAIAKFYECYGEMYRSLNDTGAEEDLVYDFGPVMKSIQNVILSVPAAHVRIESLLAGVDEGYA